MAWPDEGINVYTWANKPLATDYTGRAFISDIGGGSIWISNGTRWYPQNGSVVLYNMATPTSGTYATIGITAQYLMPGGIMQNGDTLEFMMTCSKTGTTTTATHEMRFGSAGLVTDTALNSGSGGTPGALTLTQNPYSRVKRIGVTTLKYMGSFWTTMGSSTSAMATDTTVSSLDSPIYITRTTTALTSVGDTFTLHEFTIRLIAAGI